MRPPGVLICMLMSILVLAGLWVVRARVCCEIYRQEVYALHVRCGRCVHRYTGSGRSMCMCMCVRLYIHVQMAMYAGVDVAMHAHAPAPVRLHVQVSCQHACSDRKPKA